MNESKVSKLIQQCKSNDVDVRVDAVTKLQAEFEAGAEITEPDVFIQALKACLRTSNQLLTNATLSALPPFLTLLLSNIASRPLHSSTSASASTSSVSSLTADATILRQVLLAFLPAGGIIDRLGDTRERARDKARDSLVIVGGHAFRAGGSSVMGRSKDGKAPETVLQYFERCLKELGFGSKVWRVREQSILTLVHIRRMHHLFPIKPYLTLLVEALEDSDSTVRETARTSVVEIFTGPGVTDAARADLKKELTKKGVRKTIVDGVLSKILAGNTVPTSEGSENGDGVAPKKEYVPPSIALQARRAAAGANAEVVPLSSSLSRSVSSSQIKESSRPASRSAMVSPPPVAEDTTEVAPVYIASHHDLENELYNMFKPFEGKETEHNWGPRERAILRIRGMLKGDVHVRYADTFLSHLKQIADASLKTLASLRTTVATNTCSMYNELAYALGSAMDPICEILLSNLVRMGGLTKKIVAQASQATVTIIISQTSAQPRAVIPLFWNTLQDKTTQLRGYIVEHLKTYMEVHGARAKNSLESSGMIDTLDKCIRKALSDPNVAVRQTARLCFWTFENIWHDRGHAILEAQDSTSRKQLEKACPDPQALAVPPAAAPAPKKSSIAAAIAQSRAKAKAIATAPPTLRHQATSAARSVSSSKRSLSPSISTMSSFGERAASPALRASASPPVSPRSRIVSNPASAKPPTTGRVVSHSRTSSGESLSLSQSHHERLRPASPLVSVNTSPPRGSVLRRAMQTALPASPSPSSVVTPPSPSSLMDITEAIAAPVQYPMPDTDASRQSLALPSMNISEEHSLLTAIAIPLPEDSESDMDVDETQNIISFSPRSTGSRVPVSNSLSPISPAEGIPQPIVEDALRARAEQAESAAKRLLELVEPEDETTQQHPAHPSLLLNSAIAPPTTPKAKPKKQRTQGVSVLVNNVRAPQTPNNKNTSILRRLAEFENSPAHKNGNAPLLMTDVLKPAPPKYDSAWWRKRMALVSQRRMQRLSDPKGELQDYITMLEQDTADISTLQNIALFCVSHPSVDPITPLSTGLSMPGSPSPFKANASFPILGPDVWIGNKAFERLFNALRKFLDPEKNEEQLAYALIVLWEMLEYQPTHMESREADLYAILLHVRYSNYQLVLEATNTIRDSLTSRVEAVYGLMTMHAILLAFQTEPPPVFSSTEVKSCTCAYSLIALGKFILRLPSEILEEELPRLKSTLISALNDASSLVVRESAAAVIIAAQLVLRDETHLFALLDGLADEKKNLLTYLFDKHGARAPLGATGLTATPAANIDRLEREMRRLDGRTSTPARPVAAGT